MSLLRPLQIIFLFFVGIISLQAQLSPGPLSSAHAHLSGMTECLNCHTWGNKDISPKCLDCHKPIQNRVNEEKGFHGKLDDKNCALCHTDHLDRDFKMIHWEPSKDAFDHKKTGYEIDGKHIDIKCEDCHKKDLILAKDVIEYAESIKPLEMIEHTFLGLGTECADCHKDVHDGEFKEKKCQDCHTTKAWENVLKTFDHKKDTQYPLTGAHEKVECEKCHTEKQAKVDKYEAMRFSVAQYDQCTDCHKDVHNGEFKEKKCQDCHATKSWESVLKTFDHKKDTKFPLKGAHEKVECEKCHKEKQAKVDKYQAMLFSVTKYTQCTDCHKDEHNGSFGQNCLECHNEKSFKVDNKSKSFNHDKTKYPLLGKHQKVECKKCHKIEKAFTDKTTYDQCLDCHEDYHKGAFSKSKKGTSCEGCHNVQGFTPPLFGIIQHKEARFQLDGAHLAQPCVFCHLKDNKSKYYWEKIDCEACHENAHGKQFSRYYKEENWCSRCHDTSEWNTLKFSHEKTDFPLTGKHIEITCESCHKPVDSIIQYEGNKKTCVSCHDDMHAKQLEAKTCDKCHSTTQWPITKFDHKKNTEFELDGQHKDLQCGQCHKLDVTISTIRFKPINHKCQDCHSFGDFKK
jgi:hypothetical protein